MNDVTRYARVQPSLEALRTTDGTRVPHLRVVRLRSFEDEFRASQRAMASAVREERRPGLFVFAHHVRCGFVGRLWLEAGAHPRAGTLGRHDAVDLALPLDDALSLRHALFIVRAVEGLVRCTVLDLASSRGLDVDLGRALRRFDVAGAVSLRVGDFAVLCVPTGRPLPWDPDAADPFATLRLATPSQVQPRDAAVPGSPPRRRVVGRLASRLGELSCERGYTDAELARGLLIGRDARCDVRLVDPLVSRVHAALLRVDGELLLVDAGSKNGLWTPEDREVRCVRWSEGQPILLGAEGRLDWSGTH